MDWYLRYNVWFHRVYCVVVSVVAKNKRKKQTTTTIWWMMEVIFSSGNCGWLVIVFIFWCMLMKFFMMWRISWHDSKCRAWLRWLNGSLILIIIWDEDIMYALGLILRGKEITYLCMYNDDCFWLIDDLRLLNYCIFRWIVNAKSKHRVMAVVHARWSFVWGK